jgi:arabinose-5-phosphate isomerase
MHKEWPKVSPEASLTEALKAMSEGRLGMTSVMEGSSLVGVITDGDLRRALEKSERDSSNPLKLSASTIMSRTPATIEVDALALDAAGRMEGRKITFLIVTQHGTPCGVVHIHDLLAAKVL